MGAVLKLRRSLPRLFLEGDYQPLRVEGEHSGRVVAFQRRLGDRAVVVIAPRHTVPLLPPGGESLLIPERQWGETRVLIEGVARGWRSLFTGADVEGTRRAGEPVSTWPLSMLLGALPVCVLVHAPVFAAESAEAAGAERGRAAGSAPAVDEGRKSPAVDR